MQDKIDKRRLPDIEYEGKPYSYDGNETPLEQVLESTDKSIFLVADGGVGKSTSLRTMWLDSLCYEKDSNQEKEHKSYIYVDLKLLAYSEDKNTICEYINNVYHVDITKIGKAEKPILLLDSANEAGSEFRERNGKGKCKLVEDIETILEENFRVVISSRSRNITMQNAGEIEDRERSSEFSEHKMLYCKLELLSNEVIKEIVKNVSPDSALYNLLRNNMMLKLYSEVTNYIDIDQDKITAGKLLGLYFEICFKTRYIKNVLNLRYDEEKLYKNKILIVERLLNNNPNGFGLSDEDAKIFDALKNFQFVFNYLVENSFKDRFSLVELKEKMRLSVLEHLSILQSISNDEYIWANEVYQEYFEAQKYATLINIIVNSVDNIELEIAKRAFYNIKFDSVHNYEVVQFIGELSAINCHVIDRLSKCTLMKVNENYKHFVIVLSALTGNGVPNGVNKIDFGDFSFQSNIIFQSNTSKGLSVNLRNTAIINGREHFSGFSDLTMVVIPLSVTTIGDDAFCQWRNLTNIEMHDGITSIGIGAFSFCESLKSIKIPNKVTSIQEETFSRCSYLDNISIPNQVTSIGDSAFSYCKELKRIDIPNSVKRIGGHAFWGCEKLKTIYIPLSVQMLGETVFWNDIDIYCEAKRKPEGWAGGWCGFKARVHWGITREKYNALKKQ